jgi:hypothetical protein
MWRTLLPWLLAVLIVCWSVLPALAQTSKAPADKQKDITMQDLRWRDDQPGGQPAQPSSSGPRVPAAEYALAISAMFLIMVIVCTPSRKRH